MNIDLNAQDKQHRTLALDPSQSFIVQAPAGSGKTELLIQRFLTLLCQVNVPEEVLAITFTKKAANEMRARVIKALKHALTEAEPDSAHSKNTWHLAKRVLERDQKRQWHLINNPNQLRIQTIDALCTYLTKQLPLLSHFGSQPDITDNQTAIYREAVQTVLLHVEENVEWSAAISMLLLHLDNDLNKLHNLLVSLLAKRDQWLPYIHLDTSDTEIRDQLECQLGAVISDSLINLTEIFPKKISTELLDIARFAADQLARKQTHCEIFACRDLVALPGIKAHDKRLWLGLARLLLTKSFSWRKRVDEEMGFPSLTGIKNVEEKYLHTQYRQRLSTLITTISDQENLRVALSELFFLPEANYQDAQWEILQALFQVLKIIAAQLRLSFQQYGQIDFIENAQAALTALGREDTPTDLALALDYQIKHILIDEFQDTSFSQYQLLEMLTTGWESHDGRTLFVVGDPMQSIYKFRNAEVGLFIRMRKHGIGNIKLTPLTLSVNFRSSASIVEWNNKTFDNIFPSFNDIATGAVTYSPSASHHSLNKEDADVTVIGLIDANDSDQALQLIHIIQEIKNKHATDSIAILVRSRSHLNAIIPALKSAKISYRAIDIDPLSSRQIIQDLLSLTCALLHPADRIAWLSLLRAPWCGLTLADLLIIAGKSPYTAIWQQLEKTETMQQLSTDGQIRLKRILPILKSKLSERERYDLRTWIESTWLLLGGPASLTNYTDMDDVSAYFSLLGEYSQHHQHIDLNKLKEKIQKLFASTQHSDATVQIMTIHAAKGLEFDTVIIPHLERKMPSDDKALLSWMERPLSKEQIALLLAPIHATGDTKDILYEYISRQQRLKGNYEVDRLFYVATTRAKKRLHLLFNASKKNDHDFKVETNSFLDKYWPFIENQKDHILRSIIPIQGNINPNNTTRSIKRLTTEWQNPIHELRSYQLAAHHNQRGFIFANHTPKIIGTCLHRLLELIATNGNAWWQKRSDNEKSLYLHKQLKQGSLCADDLSPATSLILKALNNMLEDPRGLWILKSHQAAASELTLSTTLDNKKENIIIDRTFIDENDTRWIIDYKTTTFTQSDLEQFLETEQEKYLAKMQKYRHAFNLLEKRKIRLGLYFPAIPAWREWGD